MVVLAQLSLKVGVVLIRNVALELSVQQLPGEDRILGLQKLRCNLHIKSILDTFNLSICTIPDAPNLSVLRYKPKL